MTEFNDTCKPCKYVGTYIEGKVKAIITMEESGERDPKKTGCAISIRDKVHNKFQVYYMFECHSVPLLYRWTKYNILIYRKGAVLTIYYTFVYFDNSIYKSIINK